MCIYSYTEADNSVVVATDSSELQPSRSGLNFLIILLHYQLRTLHTVRHNEQSVGATPNVINIDIAKISPHILSAEKFALHLGTFFVSKYAHIAKAFVTVEQLRWTRIQVADNGKTTEHSHSFYRDGDDKRIVKIEACTRYLLF